MLALDGVYVENDYGGLRFHRVKAPNVDELKTLVHAISHRVARFLEKRGFLERDAETSYLTLEPDDDDAMAQLQGHSITYRIAIGPQKGRKVFTLQTLPSDDDSSGGSDRMAKIVKLDPTITQREHTQRPLLGVNSHSSMSDELSESAHF